MKENRKPLSKKELWDLLVSTGAISPDSFEEEKEIATTCEKVIGLLARHQEMKDQSAFDAMFIFSHLQKCDSCRKEYL
ncbi:MAG TPA: hypothetical protein VJ440_06785 [Candidatus Brocadiaceae bacterium]|nr:hypothetical protein [Candidatus Brocadiaceae bacterium]